MQALRKGTCKDSEKTGWETIDHVVCFWRPDWMCLSQ